MSNQSQVASGFERSIQLFDSRLRVRWSPSLEKWVIDRVGYIHPNELDFLVRRQARFERWCREDPQNLTKLQLLREISEEIASAKDGRRVILYAATLDRRTFDMLAQSDIQRYGGYVRFSDEQERLDKLAQEKTDRASDTHVEAVNREVYDQMSFIERRRQTDSWYKKSWAEMLSSGAKPTPSDSVLPFKVVDKRVVKGADDEGAPDATAGR